MKIARNIIAPETQQNVLLSLHPQMSGSDVSFADSFGKSLAGDLQEGSAAVTPDNAGALPHAAADARGGHAKQNGAAVSSRSSAERMKQQIESALEQHTVTGSGDLSDHTVEEVPVAMLHPVSPPQVVEPANSGIRQPIPTEEQPGIVTEKNTLLPAKTDAIHAAAADAKDVAGAVAGVGPDQKEDRIRGASGKAERISGSWPVEPKHHKAAKASVTEQSGQEAIKTGTPAMAAPALQLPIVTGDAVVAAAPSVVVSETKKDIPRITLVADEKRPATKVEVGLDQRITKKEPATEQRFESALSGSASTREQDLKPHEASGSNTEQIPASTASSGSSRASHNTQVELQTGTAPVTTPIHPHASPVPQAEKTASVSAATGGGQQLNAESSATRNYAESEHRTVTATPTTLEVGLPGGAHGWLKVRAELAGDGAVHASVSSNSASGTEMLRRELPTLTSYLHQEQVRVSSVVVQAPASAMDLSNPGSGEDRRQAMNGGSPDANGSGGGREAPSSDSSVAGQNQQAFRDEGDIGESLSNGYAGLGGWLSIRA
ncbi:hypothetical protein JAO29_07265 [Edaphobacter sp. HDX4]|uniref:hypothetical protein n=1 Tax=Edaphobacter sp. HDX4 TaxID=2794064 RepID=UPI002FE526E4